MTVAPPPVQRSGQARSAPLLALLPAGPVSVTTQFLSDRLARFDCALKTHVDAPRRAAGSVRGE